MEQLVLVQLSDFLHEALQFLCLMITDQEFRILIYTFHCIDFMVIFKCIYHNNKKKLQEMLHRRMQTFCILSHTVATVVCLLVCSGGFLALLYFFHKEASACNAGVFEVGSEGDILSTFSSSSYNCDYWQSMCQQGRYRLFWIISKYSEHQQVKLYTKCDNMKFLRCNKP